MSTTTANMSLIVPASGDDNYPSSISSSLNTLDTHTHASGSGVQIPTGGIADNAITTAKINALAVTTTKIAANNVTRAKLEAVGQQFSSDVSYTGNATSYTDVTNATLSITTTGRPVIIALVPRSSDAVCEIGVLTTTAGLGAIDLRVLRGATEVLNILAAGVTLNLGTPSTGSPQVVVPASAIFLLDVPAAGTYTYKLQAQKNGGSAGASGDYFINGRLLAFEL